MIPVLSECICSCGCSIMECEHWSGALSEIDIESLKNSSHPLFNTSRFTELLYLIRAKKIESRKDDKVSLEHNKLLSFCASNSQGSYLVDSSKNTTRLRALQSEAGIEVMTVFVVRSMIEVSRSKKKNKSLQRRSQLVSSLSWALQNIVSAVYFHSISEKKMLLCFEEFLESPLAHVNSIFYTSEFINVAVTQMPDFSTQHMMAGNKIRYNKSLSRDEKSLEISRTLYEKILSGIIEKPVILIVNSLCRK